MNQRGAVLLLLLPGVLLVATLGFTLSRDSNGPTPQKSYNRASVVLPRAAQALVAFAETHPVELGLLPFPDRWADSRYDGKADCVTSGLSTAHLLGRFPYLGQQNSGGCVDHAIYLNIADFDPGQLWLAVSRNLLEHGGAQLTANWVTEAPHPWLRVYSAQGDLITSQAAFVLFYAGAVVGDQRRDGAVPDVNNYLEARHVAGVGMVSNADPSDARFVRAPPTANFNDVVLYRNAQFLSRRLARLILKQYQQRLTQFHNAFGYYPYAAQLGDASGTCVHGLTIGTIPTQLGNCQAVPHFNLGSQLDRWRAGVFYRVMGACTQRDQSACNHPNAGDLIMDHRPVKLILAAAGEPLASQIRNGVPPHALENYLDAPENLDGDVHYTQTPFGSSANDQFVALPRL